MSDIKAIRVEVEYDNGMLERATGDEAAEIWRAVNGAFALQHIHGMGYSGPKLQPVARPAVPQVGRESGWLIERKDFNEHFPTWLTADSSGFGWTTDSLKAIRFCRREDANQIAEIFDDLDVHLTEHIWD